ncbi:MAG: hypothetical protein HN341_16110 [Verrucomicrobia bacterium]|nr:hypothetical protein [Verrucomicrobiota bacterium]
MFLYRLRSAREGLHDRFSYTRQEKGGWHVDRLSP